VDLPANQLGPVWEEGNRLGIRFTVYPVYTEGQQPFLRAEGEGDFEHLAFSQYLPLTTTDRSHPL